MHVISVKTATLRARAEDGFTLLAVLGVMLVTSFLVAASFTAANGDLHLSQENTTHQQAYYAALAGVQEYQYQLQNNPDYWQTCEAPSGEEEGVHYEVKVLGATGHESCSSSSPFSTAIESKNKLANTFRIESIGCAGLPNLTSCQGELKATETRRKIVATFQVAGFLDYAYFTQYEDEDFNLYGGSQSECEKYYASRKAGACHMIVFGQEDSVRGPMHTDDAAGICETVEFGRKGHEPPDTVEIGGGTYFPCGGGTAVFNTATKSYITGTELRPPESDNSLSFYVEPANEFSGVTRLVLNGSSNTITVTNKGATNTIPWPANGLLYVQNEGACGYTYKQVGADLANETAGESACGTVYVNGSYSKSLTVAAARDLVVNGNIVPTGVTPGNAPTTTATLGLIATYYVRIYHPVEEKYAKGTGCKTWTNRYGQTVKDAENAAKECLYTNTTEPSGEELPECDAPNNSASLSSPWVYAAILSTSHSFTVDNFGCGSMLGTLHLYGALAQKFRGIVALSGSSGYVKDYNYDERLATDEPPYFLAPLKAGWKIIRETASEKG